MSKDPTVEDLADLATRYGVRDLYVFGSRAREISERMAGAGEAGPVAAGPESVVDVAVQPVTDPRAQAEHELYVLRRAADLAPFRRERIRMVLTEGAR